MILMKPTFRRCGYLAAILLAVAALTGCTISTQVGPRYDLEGTVTLGPYGLLMDEATVRVDGPVTRTTRTDANGNYSFYNLPGGAYNVEVTTLAGSKTAYISLYQDKTLNINVNYPPTLQAYQDRFAQISGLATVYYDDEAGAPVCDRGGSNSHWRTTGDTIIPLYIDDASRPSFVSKNELLNYFNQIWSLTDYKLSVQSTTQLPRYGNSADRGIVMEWGPVGGDRAAVVDLFDSAGYLYQAWIIIDPERADMDSVSVTGFMIWSSLGAHPVLDSGSVMYPIPNSSENLTSTEKSLLRYAYALAPNNYALSCGSIGYMEAQSASARRGSARRAVTRVYRASGQIEVIEGVPSWLQKRFGGDSAGSSAAGSFLWDEIGK